MGRITCGSSCPATCDSGTTVTLTARPGLLSTFGGCRGGDCSGTGPCRVTLEANTTVTATLRLLGLGLVSRAGSAATSGN